MSDLMKDLGLSKDDDPVIEAVGKIAAHAVDTERQTVEKFAKVEGQVSEVRSALTQTEQRIEDKMEAGFGVVKEYLERINKRTSMLPHFRVQDITDPLLAALTPEQKGLIRLAEPYCDDLPETSTLKEPVTAWAVNRWFKLSTMLQLNKFGSQHNKIAPEFEKLDRAFMDLQTKAALQENTTTEGGNLVPTIVEAEILRLLRDASDIWPRCRQMPMTKKVHDIPDITTAVTVNWVAEEGALTEGNPVFGKKTLTANKLAGRSTLSIELLEDSSVAILPFLQAVFAEKMGGELDFQTMEGTTPFTGVVGASSVNALATTTATAGSDITYPLLVSVFVKAGEANTRANGMWVMSPAIYGKVVGLVDSNGQPIVKLGTVESAPNGTILGRPIIVSNRLSSYTVGSDATGNIYFGPGSALVAGTRRGMFWDVTDAVNWGTFQIDARLVGRFAYVVGVPAAWTKLTKGNND